MLISNAQLFQVLQQHSYGEVVYFILNIRMIISDYNSENCWNLLRETKETKN